MVHGVEQEKKALDPCCHIIHKALRLGQCREVVDLSSEQKGSVAAVGTLDPNMGYKDFWSIHKYLYNI